jgi:Domain of unknown function (DUF4399)
MKRAIAAAAVVLLLAACGDDSTPEQKAEAPAPEASTETPAPAAEEPIADSAAETTEEPAADVAAEPTPEPVAAAEAEPEPATEPAVERTPAPEGAKVFFVTPTDGATVHAPVAIQFGVEGIEIAPAGSDAPHSGHHHVLIDTKIEDYNAPIPADANHKHFGGGQTEAALGLTPGQHTLQLVLGDKNHIPHDPPIESEVITVNVE